MNRARNYAPWDGLPLESFRIQMQRRGTTLDSITHFAFISKGKSQLTGGRPTAAPFLMA